VRTDTMGRVLVNARIESLADLFQVSNGVIPPDQVRTVEVSDALVDTGATMLSMPKRLIAQLGLEPVRARTAPAGAGKTTTQFYGTTGLTIQGRDCCADAAELPDGCPVLIGPVALLALDFVIDMPGRRLIGNPAHGGEQMIELY
jgi:predicted aspartyl protease